MDARSPVPRNWFDPQEPALRPILAEPFDGTGLLAEQNRAHASIVFRCIALQILIVLMAAAACGTAFMLAWHQLIELDAALAACAGV